MTSAPLLLSCSSLARMSALLLSAASWRQGWKKPGFFKKTSPVVFFGFYGFLDFLVFFCWVFLIFFPEERVFRVFQFQENF
jgi:hypothetical protein